MPLPPPKDLDLNVVALTRAMRTIESGGKYDIKGASGENGAYQFMPATWKEWAGKHLGDPNAPMTKENQNFVAYQKVKEWKDQGLTPDQVFAKWNSGDVNYAGKVGVNKMGVKYDVPHYVQRGMTEFQKEVLKLGGRLPTAEAASTALPAPFDPAPAPAPTSLYQNGITRKDLAADLRKGVLGPVIQRSKNISQSQGNGPLPALDKGISQVRNVVQAANQPFNAAFKATRLPKLAEKLGNVVSKGSEMLGRADAAILKAVLPEKAEQKLRSGLNAIADPNSDINEGFRSYVNQTFDPASKNALGLVADVGELAGNVVGAKQAAVAIPKIAAQVKGATATSVLQPLRDRAVASLEADYSKWAGETKAGVKNLSKVDAKVTKLNQTGTTGQAPQRILAESHIIPETEGTKFRTYDQAAEYRRSLAPLNEAQKKAIQHIDPITPKTPLSEFEERAVAKVRTSQNIASGKANKLETDIRREFAEYRTNYGDELSLETVDEIKSARYADMKFDFTQPLKSDVNSTIARTAREIVEEKATKAGFTDLAQLNREIGSRLDAAAFLEKLDGQTLKYGKLGKYVFAGIGASLGTGIVGKVLGALGGDLLAQLLMSADVAGPLKRMVLASLAEKSPEAYRATLQWIKANNIAIETRIKEGLLLKAGDRSASNSVPIELGPRTAPDTTRLFSSEDAGVMNRVTSVQDRSSRLLKAPDNRTPIPMGPKYSTDPNRGAVMYSSEQARQNMGLSPFAKTKKLPTIVLKPKGKKVVNLRVRP